MDGRFPRLHVHVRYRSLSVRLGPRHAGGFVGFKGCILFSPALQFALYRRYQPNSGQPGSVALHLCAASSSDGSFCLCGLHPLREASTGSVNLDLAFSPSILAWCNAARRSWRSPGRKSFDLRLKTRSGSGHVGFDLGCLHFRAYILISSPRPGPGSGRDRRSRFTSAVTWRRRLACRTRLSRSLPNHGSKTTALVL